jgi:alanyl-tRNA synthetase
MTAHKDTFKTGKQVRREFIDFFTARGHTFVPSSSLVPADDPTLLFANAGMNQFKDVFLGAGSRPYTRAVNTQKCIRAGGKHNDLEDVGHDTYHHTFFEMLGNWSFGDYFKAEAIEWAWELLTKVWRLPKERLYATVFAGDAADGLAADEEAAELWRTRTDIDPAHIARFGQKDNFWAAGDTGPCGPCSEIHIDLTADLSGGRLVNAGDARAIELWNLVFIQFNRDAGGKLSPLPAKHVDTGMGFERAARVLQGVASNYDIDIFRGLFKAIASVTSAGAYAGGMDDMRDVAYRVVADHARSLTFALTDGVRPSNEGRGYVLRRILRRAARYGRQYLNTGGAEFLYKLVPAVVAEMGDAFPELRNSPQAVADLVREEEAGFNKTLDRGIALFEAEAAKLESAGGKELPGQVAFELYATYGFPADLTQLMARERGMSVDMAGYEREMDQHRETSSAGAAFKVVQVAGLPPVDDSPKYAGLESEGSVLGWVADGGYVTAGGLSVGHEAALVLDRTNFYAEAGGQVGDTGRISTDSGVFVVRATQRQGDCVLHVGAVESGEIRSGQKASLTVDRSRLETMRNHTSTHLLNWALREVLGDHVQQAGSVVDPDRLRFDFSHNKAMTAEQTAQVERLVNERILADEDVAVRDVPLADALKIEGVRAMFGEKYPDPVRVVSIGAADPLRHATRAASVEFCGGTHLARTGQAGLFKIISEEAIAKGVRRITAVTGRGAVAHVQATDQALRETIQLLKAPAGQVPQRIAALQQEIKTLRKKLESGAAVSGGASADALVAAAEVVGDVKVVVGELAAASVAQLRTLVDQIRQKAGDRVAVMVGWVEQDKVTLIAAVSDSVIASAGLKAGDWVREISPIVGGGGGGKPQMAQAGGKDPAKLAEALAAAKEWAKAKLGK